jgi:hypothetical protein
MRRLPSEGKKKEPQSPKIHAQVAETFTLPALNSRKPCNFCHTLASEVRVSFVKLSALRG